MISTGLMIITELIIITVSKLVFYAQSTGAVISGR